MAAHQYRQNKELKRQSAGSRSNAHEYTDLEIGDEEEEDE